MNEWTEKKRGGQVVWEIGQKEGGKKQPGKRVKEKDSPITREKETEDIVRIIDLSCLQNICI